MPAARLNPILRRALFGAALAAMLWPAGCARPTEPTVLRWAPAERIAGSWQWVRSLDVRTTELHTPSTAGYDATLTFVAEDERSGTFVYARAGAEPVAGRFEISSEDAPGNDFITVEPGFDFLTRNAWVAAGPDSLHLGGVFELGFNSTYARTR